MVLLAGRAIKIGRWCKLVSADIQELEEIEASVKQEIPRGYSMTAKNKRVVDRLEDQRFRDHVLLLPYTLLRHATAMKNRHRAATYARCALAIELLLFCSMRRENLVPLMLDKSIRKIGAPPEATWVIEIAKEDVKNGEPLRYQLPPGSAQLLEEYLTRWRPLLSDKASAWLFPNDDGDMMDERSLAADIARKTKRELGERITPHQFRHLGSEFHLKRHPDQLTTVSYHLGHCDLNTARRYYAKSKQREATRAYQETLLVDREEARHRARFEKRSKPIRNIQHKETR
jgi:integrase